jgi:hypothetical protein
MVITVFPSAWLRLPGSAAKSPRLIRAIGGGTMAPAAIVGASPVQ